MPWYQQAMKDAQPAKSFGELEKSIDPEDIRMGKPSGSNIPLSLTEYIG